VVRSPEAFQEKQGIDARVFQKVSGIDLRQKQVRGEDLKTGKSWKEPFDQLLIATGAVSIRPRIPGIDTKGVYELNTLQSGIEVRRAVDEKNPRQIVIIGAGYIGLEMAENFIHRGVRVTVVEKTPQAMNTLDPDMAALLIKPLEEAGVKLYLNESLKALETHGGEVREAVTDQRSLPADLVILGLGVRPNSATAGEAGVPLGKTGGIKVNDRMQTEVEGIWAAGNCVESLHLVSGRPFYIALGTVANKQGRVAGINIAGGRAVFPGVLGTAMVKVFSLEVARTGLQEKEIQELGLSFVTAKIDAYTRARYYPGTGSMTLKILAEKGSGRLLGGQIVGKEGAGKRIDTLAAALHARLTVEDLINLDLGYSPPFSAVWEPIQIAARQAVNQV
jgi:NADPH-dependent 2,4-dienoyl-CoA reductase/sulfur reductase-like enzyme